MTLNSSKLSTSYELSTCEKMNYELKNTSQGNASVPRGISQYLCTYHLIFVRTINRNQSELDQTFPPPHTLSLPALPSVLQRIHHSGVASTLRVGGAVTKVFLRQSPCSIQAPTRTGDGKRQDSVCRSPEGCHIKLTLLVMSSCGAFVQGGWVWVRGYFSGQYVTDKNLTLI